MADQAPDQILSNDLEDTSALPAAYDPSLHNELDDQQLAVLRQKGISDPYVKNNVSDKWFNPKVPEQQDNALLDALNQDPTLLNQYDKFTPEEKASVQRLNLTKEIPLSKQLVGGPIFSSASDSSAPASEAAPEMSASQRLLGLLNPAINTDLQEPQGQTPGPASLVAPRPGGPKQYTIDAGTGELGTNANLQAAQQAAAGAQLTNRLGGAASIIGAGLSHSQDQGQKVFDQQAKDSEQVTQNFLQQVANEKNDPSSPVSKAFRDYAKQLGVSIQGDFSAADGEKLLPMIFKGYEADESRQARSEDLKYKYDSLAQQKQQHDEMLAANKELVQGNKEDQQQDKNYIQMNSQANQLQGGRGMLSIPTKKVQAVDSLTGILGQYPDLSKMPPEQVTEFVSAFNNLTTGGQGTDVKFKKLLPSNLQMSGSKVLEWLTSEPQGANQQQFLQQFLDSAQIQKDIAQQQIKEGLIKHASGFEGKIKDADLQNFYSTHSISPDEIDTVKGGKRLVSPSAGNDALNITPKQQTLLQTFKQNNPNISSDAQAIQVLKDNGYWK